MEQLMIYGLAGMTLLSILLIFAGLRRMAVNRSPDQGPLRSIWRAQCPGHDAQARGGGGGLQIAGMVDRAVGRQTFAQRLARDLARADLKITSANIW